MNHFLILIKPDAFERNIEQILICRLLNEFPLIDIKKIVVTEELCDAHYAEHINKPFYPNLKKAMVGNHVIALEVLSQDMEARKYCEKIRKEYVDYEYVGPRNIIHCSDSIEAGIRECALWFGEAVVLKENFVATKPKSKSVRKASKIVDKEDFLEKVELALVDPKLGGAKLYKDLEKVKFDFENYGWSIDEYLMYGSLIGYNKIGDIEFCGCAAGGDWEYPVFFIIYLDQDGKTLRGFIPKEGNAWNYNTNKALGNDSEADIEFLTKALKLPHIDDFEDEFDAFDDFLDGFDHNDHAEDLIDCELIKKSILSRLEVV
jgi:nucleoside-diphosphate kinase